MEEPISDDINAWQAQVSKKPPLEEPRTWQGQCLGGETRDGKSTRGMCKFGRNHPVWEVKPAKVLMGERTCGRYMWRGAVWQSQGCEGDTLD